MIIVVLFHALEIAIALPKRTAKARMITVQEAVSLGCNKGAWSCPVWMSGYLSDSTFGHGGAPNDEKADIQYWTMSTYPVYGNTAWTVYSYQNLDPNNTTSMVRVSEPLGARAVVVVIK